MNKTNCYILTKEGKTYNEDGKQYVLNHLRTKHDINTNVVLLSGAELNDPATLRKFIEDDRDSAFIVVSSKDSITFVPNSSMGKVINALKEAPSHNHSSWETLMYICGKEPY